MKRKNINQFVISLVYSKNVRSDICFCTACMYVYVCVCVCVCLPVCGISSVRGLSGTLISLLSAHSMIHQILARALSHTHSHEQGFGVQQCVDNTVVSCHSVCVCEAVFF